MNGGSDHAAANHGYRAKNSVWQSSTDSMGLLAGVSQQTAEDRSSRSGNCASDKTCSEKPDKGLRRPSSKQKIAIPVRIRTRKDYRGCFTCIPPRTEGRLLLANFALLNPATSFRAKPRRVLEIQFLFDPRPVSINGGKSEAELDPNLACR